MTGISAGLADSGYIPFAYTFANFAALRSCEFMRHFMGYMNCNVKMVGIGAGFSMELFGNTHYALEDIAALRSIPNIVILSPADGLEIAKCMYAAVEYNGPVYIRLAGIMNHPIVYRKDFAYQLGKANILKEEGAVALLATGSMVANALQATKILEQKGIKCMLADVHTIKPIDTELLDGIIDKKLVVTIEEHSSVGGLGSTVAEHYAGKEKHPELLRLGTGMEYLKAGDYHYMLKKNGLDAEGIAASVYNNIIKRRK